MERISGDPVEKIILLAEDRGDDVLLVQKAFERAYITNPVYVVNDGEKVLQYLQGIGKFANRDEFPFPDLLLLDLKMPRMDGFEVLEWIRSQPNLNRLRIIVLTSSQNIQDVNRAYQLGASSFMVKPLDFEHYTALARSMAEFWLEHSQSPNLAPDEKEESPR
jgi:CheY-like chemotaxis protein